MSDGDFLGKNFWILFFSPVSFQSKLKIPPSVLQTHFKFLKTLRAARSVTFGERFNLLASHRPVGCNFTYTVLLHPGEHTGLIRGFSLEAYNSVSRHNRYYPYQEQGNREHD